MFAKAIKDLNNGFNLHYVWIYQAYHDITAKYKRTVLGSLWLAGGMVVTSVAFSVLFGALFKISIKEALPYIMSGILVFGLISYVMNEGAEMFMNSGGIIKNHAYPFTFYAFHTLCKQFFTFLHNSVVYFIFVGVIGALVVPHWSILPALLLCLIFMFSWGMLLAMLASRYRDMRFMLPFASQLLSTLTPIFWRPTGLPQIYQTVINLNPFFSLIEIVRQPLLGSPAPSIAWASAIAYTALGILLWIVLFGAFRRRIPFWV